MPPGVLFGDLPVDASFHDLVGVVPRVCGEPVQLLGLWASERRVSFEQAGSDGPAPVKTELEAQIPAIGTLARYEGLPCHAQAAEARATNS